MKKEKLKIEEITVNHIFGNKYNVKIITSNPKIIITRENTFNTTQIISEDSKYKSIFDLPNYLSIYEKGDDAIKEQHILDLENLYERIDFLNTDYNYPIEIIKTTKEEFVNLNISTSPYQIHSDYIIYGSIKLKYKNHSVQITPFKIRTIFCSIRENLAKFSYYNLNNILITKKDIKSLIQNFIDEVQQIERFDLENDDQFIIKKNDILTKKYKEIFYTS